MNTKEQEWEQELDQQFAIIIDEKVEGKVFHNVDYGDFYGRREELKDFIRETRVDAVGEVYTFVVNHFTNEQEKFEFFKWWSEKYHPNPINEPLSEFNDL